MLGVPLIFSQIQRASLLLRRKIRGELHDGNFAFRLSDRAAVCKPKSSLRCRELDRKQSQKQAQMTPAYQAFASWARRARYKPSSVGSFWWEGWAWGPALLKQEAGTEFSPLQEMVCSYDKESTSPVFLNAAAPKERTGTRFVSIHPTMEIIVTWNKIKKMTVIWNQFNINSEETFFYSIKYFLNIRKIKNIKPPQKPGRCRKDPETSGEWSYSERSLDVQSSPLTFLGGSVTGHHLRIKHTTMNDQKMTVHHKIALNS